MVGEFIWVPVSQVTEPQGNIVRVHRDTWWLTNDAGLVAFYKPNPRSHDLFPQCNSNKDIAERIRENYGGDFTGVVCLPLSFSPYRD